MGTIVEFNWPPAGETDGGIIVRSRRSGHTPRYEMLRKKGSEIFYKSSTYDFQAKVNFISRFIIIFTLLFERKDPLNEDL